MSVEPAEAPRLDPTDTRPKFRQIASAIRASIEAGEYPDGKLPSGPQLAEQYDVARMTISDAIRELRDEGLVVSKQGVGVFVRERNPADGERSAKAELREVHDELARLQAQLENVQVKIRSLIDQS
ncbi:GntR family transcriptional regulator [Nocardiopsis sp. FIRDI 009]|uniref:GntR family transcriptional regulator n=1 Tax=Nocardiopsis sp. FIRDI 009 TaxID=714197 RepID=UPI000E256F4D|nr:GntR family transcriptional regulator [Nocardiopsis sp. FIRDI 009]